MPARFDLHVHTQASYDAKGSILDVALEARERGLHGFAVTDHNVVPDADGLRDAMERTGLLILSGSEVSTVEGHVLALGIDKEVAKGQGLADTVRAVERQGGVAVPSHPLRALTGIGPSALRDHADAGRIHLCEAVNARERRFVQQNTRRLLEETGLGMIGGSDAHWIHDVGTAWTRFEAVPQDAAELLALLRQGACRAEGGTTPRRKVWGHGLSLPVRAIKRRL